MDVFFLNYDLGWGCSVYYRSVTFTHGFLEPQSQQAARKDSQMTMAAHCSLKQRHVVAHKRLTAQSK